MPDSWDIRRQIERLKAKLVDAKWPSKAADDLAEAIGNKRAQLFRAVNRELKALAKHLTYKADIYGPNGRIFSCDGCWGVGTADDGSQCLTYTTHGNVLTHYKPEQLRDGNGQTINTP
jgi:hypothetical protein